MKKQNAVCLAVVSGLLVAGRALAGSLDPTNAPGPTMHTLEEIYQKVQNLVAYTNVTDAVVQTGQTTSYQAGDDGAYQKGVAWPNPRFTVQADTNCVLDNLTGLIWARDANLGGTMTWSNAIVYCEALNYGGQSDWRLPNVKELYSLIDLGSNNPLALPYGHPFAGVQFDLYWSGTSLWIDTTRAWSVDMTFGRGDYGYSKASGLYVWPVRGGQ